MLKFGTPLKRLISRSISVCLSTAIGVPPLFFIRCLVRYLNRLLSRLFRLCRLFSRLRLRLYFVYNSYISDRLEILRSLIGEDDSRADRTTAKNRSDRFKDKLPLQLIILHAHRNNTKTK